MKIFLKNPEKKEVYMAQRTKSKQMKIKQPSLKGMKNTKYLGHFAQDKYIQKGHNLSGVFPTADIEKFAVSNPFEANLEMQRRQNQINKEASDYLSRLQQSEQQRLQEPDLGAGSEYWKRTQATLNDLIAQSDNSAENVRAIQNIVQPQGAYTPDRQERIKQIITKRRGKFLEEL